MLALRYAWRSLSRSKGFVIVAVLALGLGLGLATTMFGVMDAILNPYVPYRDPDALYRLTWRLPRFAPVGGPDLLRAVRDRVTNFEAVVPMDGATAALEAGDRSREIEVGRVPAEYFTVMGVRPRSGRVLLPGDGDDAAVVASTSSRSETSTTRWWAGPSSCCSSRA